MDVRYLHMWILSMCLQHIHSSLFMKTYLFSSTRDGPQKRMHRHRVFRQKYRGVLSPKEMISLWHHYDDYIFSMTSFGNITVSRQERKSSSTHAALLASAGTCVHEWIHPTLKTRRHCRSPPHPSLRASSLIMDANRASSSIHSALIVTKFLHIRQQSYDGGSVVLFVATAISQPPFDCDLPSLSLRWSLPTLDGCHWYRHRSFRSWWQEDDGWWERMSMIRMGERCFIICFVFFSLVWRMKWKLCK